MDDFDPDRFRRRHAILGSHVEHLRLAAREMDDLSDDERADVLSRIVAFYTELFVPHAEEAERDLHARLRDVLGDYAIRGLREERAWIERRVADLAQVGLGDTQRIEELLYGLHTLTSLHFWKEEELVSLLEEEALLIHEP